MSHKYNCYLNMGFEEALHDCKLFDEGIEDAASYQRADAGIVLGHMDRIIEALEKQTPKKPYYKLEDDLYRYFCSVCKSEVLSHEAEYCYKCGRKIDWKD